MNWHVIDVRHISDYILLLTFRDGSKKSIDLEPYLKGEIFQPLRDLSYFKKVRVNVELDTICWENGADFAPEFLFEKGKKFD